MGDFTFQADTSIPRDDRANSSPIQHSSGNPTINGADLQPETGQVGGYRERPRDYPDASKGRSGQGGL